MRQSIVSFSADHDEEIEELTSRFVGYRKNVDRPAILAWLAQFDDRDLELALKVLQHVRYFDQAEVIGGFRVIHNNIYQNFLGGTLDNVFFCGFGNPGESGQTMLYSYRDAAQMKGRGYDSKFIYVSELARFLIPEKQHVGSKLRIVFVDDLIGSGDQAKEYWEDIKQYLPEEATCFLAVLVGFREAVRKVESETRLDVKCGTVLEESDRVFSVEYRTFSREEQDILRRYCERAGTHPTGYKDTQSLVVFHHSCPNNTISILRAVNPRWRGLFPRY